MNGRRQFIFWATAALVLVFLIWGLRSILLPFAAGLAAAYFLDPLVDRVERLGVGRTIATTIVTALFFLAIIAVFALLAPILFANGATRSLELGKPELWAALPTLLFAWKTKSLGGTVVVGMLCYWLVEKIPGWLQIC